MLKFYTVINRDGTDRDKYFLQTGELIDVADGVYFLSFDNNSNIVVGFHKNDLHEEVLI